MNLDLIPAIIVVIMVATVGSAIQRVTGFGFGIFAMIFLSRIISVYGQANALSGLLSFTSTLIVALSFAKKVDWKNLIFPCIGFAVISVPSILLMKKLDNRALLIMLGVMLILLSIYMFFFSSKIKIKPNPFTGNGPLQEDRFPVQRLIAGNDHIGKILCPCIVATGIGHPGYLCEYPFSNICNQRRNPAHISSILLT